MEAGGRIQAVEGPVSGEGPALENGNRQDTGNRIQTNGSPNNENPTSRTQESAGKKQIALTFDDGPHPEYTL